MPLLADILINILTASAVVQRGARPPATDNRPTGRAMQAALAPADDDTWASVTPKNRQQALFRGPEEM